MKTIAVDYFLCIYLAALSVLREYFTVICTLYTPTLPGLTSPESKFNKRHFLVILDDDQLVG